MNLLVNAVPMSGLLTGISRYLRNLYTHISALQGADISYFLKGKVLPAMPPMADSSRWQQMAGAARKLPPPIIFGLRAGKFLSHEQRLARICTPQKFSLYHETAFTPSKLTGVPTVFSLYDLSLIKYRQTHPKERVWLFDYFIKSRLPFARHILTISEFIRQEIIDELKVPAAMVTAVPLAQDPIFTPARSEDIHNVRQTYGLPGSYLLFVGSLEPRKNIDLLIDALSMAKTDIPLVLAGWEGWGEKLWLEKLKNKKLAKRIYFTGHVPDTDLKAVYSGAQALVYPSLYEGFGLPIVEAMACGCPVICSNAASMPEVAGNAACFIDPKESADLACALDLMVHDTKLRQDYISKGLARAARFSWDKTARETFELFRQVAQ